MRAILLFVLLLQGRAEAAETASSQAEAETISVRSPWQAVFKSKNDFAATNNLFNDALLVSVLRGGLRYRFDQRRSSVGAFQEFEFLSKQGARKNPFGTKDLFLQFTRAKLFLLPLDWYADLYFRFYLPTGERTRFFTKRRSAEYVWLDFIRKSGDFTTNLQLIATHHNQSQPFYVNEKNKKTANDSWEASPVLIGVYALHPRLSVWHSTGLEYVWSYKVKGEGTAQTASWVNETGFSWKVAKGLYALPSLANYAPFDSRTVVRLYRPAEMSYRLVMEWKI